MCQFLHLNSISLQLAILFPACTIALFSTPGYTFSKRELLQSSNIAAKSKYSHLYEYKVGLIGLLFYSGDSMLTIRHIIVR